MEELNKQIFMFINQFVGVNQNLDFLQIIIAEFTPLIFLFFVLYLWFSNRKYESLNAVYAVFLGLFINKIISLFYYHNRPFKDFENINLFFHEVQTSFPSNHATSLISMSLIFMLYKNSRKVGFLLFILAILCSFSRVYCGVHYPFDILGSFIVSIFVCLLIYIFRNKLFFINEKVVNLYKKIISSYK